MRSNNKSALTKRRIAEGVRRTLARKGERVRRALALLDEYERTGLSIDRMSADLAKVELVRLAGTGAWRHPLGDEHADLIVAGILNPDALTREQHTELFAVFGAKPERRVETVEATQEFPGRFGGRNLVSPASSRFR